MCGAITIAAAAYSLELMFFHQANATGAASMARTGQWGAQTLTLWEGDRNADLHGLLMGAVSNYCCFINCSQTYRVGQL